MGIISKLLRHQAPAHAGSKPADAAKDTSRLEPDQELAAVERSLQELADERRKAQGEIDARLADRSELLLIDDSDAPSTPPATRNASFLNVSTRPSLG